MEVRGPRKIVLTCHAVVSFVGLLILVGGPVGQALNTPLAACMRRAVPILLSQQFPMEFSRIFFANILNFPYL